MIIDQGDLLWGMSMIFVKKFMDIAKTVTYEEGDYIFREGDDANHFHTLIEGRVDLNVGEAGDRVYVVKRAGETFGWSSLVDRKSYSASARCMGPTVLLRIDRKEFDALMQDDPVNGMLFYKNLAGMLGNRLIHRYQTAWTISVNHDRP